MKKIAVVLIILGFSTFIFPTNNQLKNGTCYVKYDRQFKEQYLGFKLTIYGSKVVVSGIDGKKDLQIEWIDQSHFRLIKVGEKQDSLSELQKQLCSLGDPYYEITKWRNYKTTFTLWQNPYIKINTGVFIKQR